MNFLNSARLRAFRSAIASVSSQIDSKRKARVLTDVELFEISLVRFQPTMPRESAVVKGKNRKRKKWMPTPRGPSSRVFTRRLAR